MKKGKRAVSLIEMAAPSPYLEASQSNKPHSKHPFIQQMFLSTCYKTGAAIGSGTLEIEKTAYILMQGDRLVVY